MFTDCKVQSEFWWPFDSVSVKEYVYAADKNCWRAGISEKSIEHKESVLKEEFQVLVMLVVLCSDGWNAGRKSVTTLSVLLVQFSVHVSLYTTLLGYLNSKHKEFLEFKTYSSLNFENKFSYYLNVLFPPLLLEM